jgi:hypothetical protein
VSEGRDNYLAWWDGFCAGAMACGLALALALVAMCVFCQFCPTGD